MISEKFVKISRHVIEHIQKGHFLTQNQIVFSNGCCCPLGAVCVNSKIFNFNELYKFSQNETKLGNQFWIGFDEYYKNSKLRFDNDEDYIIGYKLAEMCYKRNWIKF